MKHFINFIKGMIIGVANVIPGVSGGTMAVVFGIYEKIIEIIGNIFKHLKSWKLLKEDIIFALPLGLGAVTGILVLSKLMTFLLANYQMQTILCFVGLVLGSIPLLFKNSNKEGFKKSYIIPAVVTFLIMLLISYLNIIKDNIDVTKVLTTDFRGCLELIGYGFISMGTMIIPGISGSLVLLLLGVYENIMSAISSLQILTLIPFAIGMGLGFLVFSKVISILLKKAYGHTYYGILGFVIGSIPAILTEVQFTNNVFMILTSAVACVVGFVFSYWFGKISN